MTDDFNLSKKIYFSLKGRTKHDKAIELLEANDVKEFIKRLKKESKEWGRKWSYCLELYEEYESIINKLAGEKLI